MKSLGWAGLLVAAGAMAQDSDTTAGPQWSLAVDLVGPVRGALTAGGAEPYLQLDAAVQHWAWGDLAWRAGYGMVSDRWTEDRERLVVLDSATFEQEHIAAREQAHTLRVGAVVQHRDRTFAPSAGASLVLGVERQQAVRTATGLRPDTLPCVDCVLEAIPGHVSALDGERRDTWGHLGVEAALALSCKVGRRIELEARVPFGLRWRFMLAGSVTGTAPQVEPWTHPWRFSVGFPALFVHVRW